MNLNLKSNKERCQTCNNPIKKDKPCPFCNGSFAQMLKEDLEDARNPGYTNNDDYDYDDEGEYDDEY